MSVADVTSTIGAYVDDTDDFSELEHGWHLEHYFEYGLTIAVNP
jgi:hypothetical protein